MQLLQAPQNEKASSIHSIQIIASARGL